MLQHGNKKIADTKQTLSEVKKEITTLEIKPLIRQANEAKSKQNYAKAIEQWREILRRQADHPLAVPALAELEDKVRYQAQAQQLMSELALHVGVLHPIWQDLFAQLRTPSSSDIFKSLILYHPVYTRAFD
ncbi:MAG TPA: hypothetical protein ENJ33_06195 [Thiothrix sp.]|nr:hypothetical protein [Thiothrix sp.]